MMTALYIGNTSAYLKGKTCIIQKINNIDGEFGVQFDDRDIKEAYGCHWFKQDEFHIVSVNDWFSSSYASWLTMPRVMIQSMPSTWQVQFTKLLEEYEATFPNQPKMGTQVRVTDMRNRLIPTPDWIVNYCHPNIKLINNCRGKS